MISSLIPQHLIHFIEQFRLVVFRRQTDEDILLFLTHHFLISFGIPDVRDQKIRFVGLFRPLQLAFDDKQLVYLQQFHESDIVLGENRDADFAGTVCQVCESHRIALLRLDSADVFDQAHRAHFLVVCQLGDVRNSTIVVDFAELVDRMAF